MKVESWNSFSGLQDRISIARQQGQKDPAGGDQSAPADQRVSSDSLGASARPQLQNNLGFQATAAVAEEKLSPIAQADTTNFQANKEAGVQGNASDNQSESATDATSTQKKEGQDGSAAKSDSSSQEELSSEDERALTRLKTSDKRVRAHEQAHLSVAGALARGGASYEYETGPDGNMYAVGGEVSIDAAPVPKNPRATISKMEQVVRAALAPVDPSSQDRAVAASASSKAVQAEVELHAQGNQDGTGAYNIKSVQASFKTLASVYTQASNYSPRDGYSLDLTQ